MNPPPGSTDPERFATVSIGIGDRVLFHPAPREPRHKWCEVSLRTETGRSQATCLGLSVGYPSAPSKLLCRHHTAVPGPKRAAGVQCRHCHRPAGNFVAATDGVNESRTPSGTAPGARAEPVKPCPALPSRVVPRHHVSGSLQGNCGCTVRLFRPRQGNFVSEDRAPGRSR